MGESRLDFYSFSSAVVFIISFLLVGVPIWWKTTEVYRYPIPHDECQRLLSKTVLHTISVRLVIEDQNVQQGLLWEALHKIPNDPNDSLRPSINFQWSMSGISNEEKNILNNYHHIADLDLAFRKYFGTNPISKNKHGEIIIYILNKQFTKQAKFFIGCSRQGYILNDSNPKDLAQDINTLVKKMAQSDLLKKLYTSPSSYGGDKILDKDKMRYFRTLNNFDITYSLIVPEPQILEIHWDIQNAINAYLKNILEDLSVISKINVKSQVLYMTSLPIPIQTSRNEKSEKFIVYSEDLPSLINPAESKLGSDTSVHPNLNFVIYIPTQKQTPLRIYESKNEPLESNAFLIPQWGGFMIYNVPLPENVSLPHRVNLNKHAFMSIFLSQFRLLLGLSERSTLVENQLQVIQCPILCDWEIDFLLRQSAQEQLSSSMSSISSLSQLLLTIRNIVIKDDIGGKIHFALLSIEQSLQLLSEGKLQEGFKKAQAAFISSDEAFFDPSLLALLYFPEDQKYAIYIPLFLPISIPVVASLQLLWKYKKQMQQKQKTA